MGVPQSPNPPHLYPQALQLKLYQAFIFSIPILFSIILFLLFYLFYLKRRASNTLSSPLPRPRRSHQTTTYNVSSTCHLDFKLEIKDELPIVLFDEELRNKDSQCCVCLGDFVMKEELLQVPSCKHVFHIDCIHLWLHTNTTCPLCRCSVLLTIPSKPVADSPNHPPPPVAAESPPLQVNADSGQSQPIPSSDSQEDQEEQASTSSNIFTTIAIEEASYENSTIPPTNLSNSQRLSLSQLPDRDSENMGSYSGQGSVVVRIQTHGT